MYDTLNTVHIMPVHVYLYFACQASDSLTIICEMLAVNKQNNVFLQLL